MIIKATLILKSTFKCSVCGIKRIGDSYTKEMSNPSISDIIAIKELLHPGLMPIGWSSHYNKKYKNYIAYKCSECNKE